MTLPIRQLPATTFHFRDGTPLPIRGLSRAEALHLRTLNNDIAEIEVHTIKAATGATEAQVREWCDSTPNDEVAELVDAIAALSGFDLDSGKDDAEDSHSAKLIESITSLQRILDNLSPKSDS